MNKVMSSIKNSLPKNLQEIYPDTQIEKFIYKIPIFAWRLGLGPILGKYILIFTHIGRKTGEPRRTAVEFHTINGMKYIPCTFGVKSQWYRNLLANPRVTIQSADGTEQMIAIRVTENEELISVIDTITERNPSMMKWYLDSLNIQHNRKDILAHKQELIFLRFDPTSDPTPRGLEVDLAWIWPILLFWTLIRQPFGKKRK
jgi:deazaflavin-dependent oxidoreductase (nitroreductase family)